jgi:DNA-binding transcriptional ArsR family regulator
MVRPYRHTYDDIITDYIMKEESVQVSKRKKFWELPVIKRRRTPLSQSFSKLYRVIKESYPTVSRTTIQRHLNRMVREHVLIRYPKGGRRYNQTLYRLNTEGLVIYYEKALVRQLEKWMRAEEANFQEEMRLYELHLSG